MIGGRTLKAKPVWMGGRRCLSQRPKRVVVLRNRMSVKLSYINTKYFLGDQKKITNGKINKQHVVFVCVLLIKLYNVVPALIIHINVVFFLLISKQDDNF